MPWCLVDLVAASALLVALPDAGNVNGRDVTVRTFRTDVQPRVDPVFGGVAELRKAIDEFLALEGDMQKTRDALSAAVHQALAEVQKEQKDSVANGSPGAARRTCSPATVRAQDKARVAGRRFLALGRRFEARFREIRRGLSLGDTVGLTPDYRLKANRARALYDELLRDYQEMRVAFHDQLGAELRYAGCKPDLPSPPGQPQGGDKLATARPAGREPQPLVLPPPEPLGQMPPDPENLADWSLASPTDPLPSPVDERAGDRTGGTAADASQGGNNASPAIWIEIDNTRCGQPSSFTLDGRALATIPAGKKVQIRVRSGPHALCVLPTTDPRACGSRGTVRRAYLHEGWSMAVRCQKPPAPPLSAPRVAAPLPR